MPDGGYKTSSEAMMRAQTRLREAGDEPASQAKKVAPTEVTQEEFGKAHSQFFTKYQTGIEEIGAAMNGLSAELTALGGNVGAAGQQYGDAEANTQSTLNAAGGDQ